MTPASLTRFILLAGLWGASFLFMRIAAPEFDPWWTALLRIGLAWVAMALWCRWRGLHLHIGAHWKQFAVLGLFNNAIPFALYAYAALHLPAGYSAILNALTPLFAALVAMVMLRERLRWQVFAAVLLALGGIALLSRAGPVALNGETVPAMLACVGATLCYGFAGPYAKRYLSKVPAAANATNSMLFASLALTPPALLDLPSVHPSAGVWAAMGGLALLCTALAYFLYYRLIADIGAVRAGTVTFLIPAFGMFWGWLFLGEPITPGMLGGFAMVLIAAALVLDLVPGLRTRAVAA